MGQKGRLPVAASPALSAEEPPQPTFSTLILFFASVKIILHMAANAFDTYGYFRDEFYYLACAEHLDWGYVDHPPLSIALLALNRLLLGDSLIALRFLPALAGATAVSVTGLVTRELGGNGFAISLACLAVIIAPVFLAIGGFYSMNAFDLLFWCVLLYILVMIIRREKETLWIAFGILAGLGLMNKISVLFLGFGLVIGLILTPQRTIFRKKWIWLGGITAAIFVLPHILWQIAYGWPTLEFIERATQFKNVPLSPLEFFFGQVQNLHPVLLPLWLAGLWYFFAHPDGRRYRVVGWMYVAIFILLVAQQGKAYYLSPMYPILFAGGAVAVQQWIGQLGRQWLKPALLTVLILAGLVAAPFGVPVLPVEAFIAYQRALGLEPRAEERSEPGLLPQIYADRFGWEELVATVVSVYRSLPPEDQKDCLIYTQNYGEAGAISFFGKHFDLPRVVSGHNNYHLWGPGRDSVRVVLIVGGTREDHLQEFESVEEAGRTACLYCMPYENDLPIYVARGLKFPLSVIWPETRNFI